jgi:pilus assembly protein CpaC
MCALGVLLGHLAHPIPAIAQEVVSQAERVIRVGRGRSVLLVEENRVERIAVADTAVIDAVSVSAQEVLVNGRKPGTTTMIVWDRRGISRLYTVEVQIDTVAVQQTMKSLFPRDSIRVEARGNAVMLTGTVRDSATGRRAVEVARQMGGVVLENLVTATAVGRQVLLQVRIAEVSRSAVEQIGIELRGSRGAAPADVRFESISDQLMRVFLFGSDNRLEALIRGLQTRGLFKSLAEPNLIALDGQEASFLAGGEFPFPVIQGGQLNAITIVWKEFGVRLRFTPTITALGTIRLRVAPEVSSLDFANGLRISGLQIPSLLSRKAETEVELREGQHLGIAGLLNNSIRDNTSGLPWLARIPIIGALFRSTDKRQERTELLVIVTPRLVEASDIPPRVPTGDPRGWKWDPWMRSPSDSVPRGTRPDSTGLPRE